MRRTPGSAAAVIAASVLLLTGCSLIGSGSAATRDEDGTIIEAGDTGAADLRIGDCIAIGTGAGAVQDVPTVPCGQPHDQEVYTDFLLPEGQYPGDGEVRAQADRGCFDAFEGFVGLSYGESDLDLTYLYPSDRTWAQGDRLVTCLVFDPVGPVSGSLEGAAR